VLWRWLASALPLGPRGERAAAAFLRRRGYRIVARSWRSPAGEVDIIARCGRTLVFAEVKTRASADRGEPWEAVDRRKQARIARAAAAYLQGLSRRGMDDDWAVRFDVVAITWPEGRGARPTVEHFEAAFEAP